MTVRLYARDLNNRTFTRANDSLVLIPQILMYVMASNGAMLSFIFSGVANDASGQIYFNFTTYDRVRFNGFYYV